MDSSTDFSRFLAAKQKSKLDLLRSEELRDKRVPLIVIDMEEQKFPEDFLQGLDRVGVPIILLSPKINLTPFKHIEWFSAQEKAKWFFAADAVVSAAPAAEEIMKFGSVPIAPFEGPRTKNYAPLHETGNGFYFEQPNKWEMFAAVIRALENYQFSYDWENLMKTIYQKAKTVQRPLS